MIPESGSDEGRGVHRLFDFHHSLPDIRNSLFNIQAHTFRRTFDCPHCGFEVRCVQVGHLLFGNFLNFGSRNRTNLFAVWLCRAFCNSGRLSQKVCRGRRFRLKCERTIGIDRNNDRNFHIRVFVLGLCIKRLAEFHNVYAVLAERRTDRRRRICFAGWNLQFYVCFYFLCHYSIYDPGKFSGNVLVIRLKTIRLR